jgi:hypothetical protein
LVAALALVADEAKVALVADEAKVALVAEDALSATRAESTRIPYVLAPFHPIKVG